MHPRPLLVLVHGSRFSRRQWSGYAAQLPSADVVAVDLPGHGERVGMAFTVGSALDVIDEAVRSGGPGRRVVLAGHSLGGYLASLYAAEHPGTLAGLVLLGATGDPAGRLTGVYTGFAKLLPRVGFERMARLANAVIRALGARPEDLPDAAAYPVLGDAWDAVVERCGPHVLTTVDCPVTIANGRWDQMRIHAARFAAAAPQARVVVVEGASHLFPLTHRAATVETLRRALAEAAPRSCAEHPRTMDR
ncbi:alpha/beta fold hydrolase [Ornithinimicrobium sp. W1679]|uniref:alpha/beta fold hydrolase n=1 Tax=unclassified Ornithinimicrobium TaxID=2615080 RepID=UPI003CF15CE5